MRTIEEKRKRDREHKKAVYERDREKIIKRVQLYYLEIKKDSKKREAYCEKSKIRIARWRKSNLHKKAANQSVYYAIKKGSLIKLPCKVCGNKKTEAHHDDYSKPLKVKWLCKLHHTEADRGRRKKLSPSKFDSDSDIMIR